MVVPYCVVVRVRNMYPSNTKSSVYNFDVVEGINKVGTAIYIKDTHTESCILRPAWKVTTTYEVIDAVLALYSVPCILETFVK